MNNTVRRNVRSGVDVSRTEGVPLGFLQSRFLLAYEVFHFIVTQRQGGLIPVDEVEPSQVVSLGPSPGIVRQPLIGFNNSQAQVNSALLFGIGLFHLVYTEILLGHGRNICVPRHDAAIFRVYCRPTLVGQNFSNDASIRRDLPL